MKLIPYYCIDLERIGIADNESYNCGELYEQECSLLWKIAIHPLKSRAIVINYSGFELNRSTPYASMDGFHGKYVEIAELIRKRAIGAVVRTGNREWGGFEYEQSVQDDLKRVIEYAIENSREICGAPEPDIYLMGTSAGGSAVAAVGPSFAQVKNMLLIAPSLDLGEEPLKLGLSQYSGELYITVGEKDRSSSVEWGRKICSFAGKASVKEVVSVPDCDHKFTGPRNARILSKAPLWAFAGDETYPDPEGGIEMYI